MEIKTLTTFGVYNYGASLQAYALQTYLKSLGHHVEIIDYQPEYLTRKFNYLWVNPDSWMSKWLLTRIIYRILKFCQRQTMMANKKKFDQFTSNELFLTKDRYETYDELYMNPPNADLYIVGSDQVWNVMYENGKDPVFFLEFVKSGDKASYAASFSYLDIDDENKSRIYNSLIKFKAVSVREYHGLDLLNSIGVKSTWVLDPIFLLSKEQWTSKIVTNNSYHEPYILVYDFEGDKNMKLFARQYAKAHNLKIYSVSDRKYRTLYADKHFVKAGPFDFLSLIYHCDAFVSNSFHGTAFSILFNKPAFVFERNLQKVNSRMESLLKLFNLEDCLLTSDSDYRPAINKIFNYKEINEILTQEIQSSKNFIDTLL